MAFKWRDRYSLNIPEIDTQHKKLFEIGNRAYDLAILDDGHDRYDEIMAIVDELLDYTEYHFKYEEGLMEKYKYLGIDHQHREHSFYIDKIKTISAEKVDDDQQKAVLNILDFLSEWISSHILISDRKYADYFKEKGIF